MISLSKGPHAGGSSASASATRDPTLSSTAAAPGRPSRMLPSPANFRISWTEVSSHL